MGIDQNTYVVTLRKAIRGVRILKWRRIGRKTNLGSSFVPYSLAMYLNLVPCRARDLFSNALYDFSHKDFDDLKADNSAIVRVTSKGPLEKVVTIDLSKVL